MIDLAPLRYFQAAYETGTFSAAARMTAVRQPSVSAAIARLEDHYGGALFHRRATGLVPTDLGHELYRQAGVILAQLQHMETRLAGKTRPVLRLHMAPDVLAAPLDHGLRQISAAREGALLQFTDTAQQADVVLCSAPCAPDNMRFQPLWEEEYAVALPLGHRLAAQQAVTLADLQGQPLIARPYCPTADALAAADGARPAVAAEALHDAQLLDLVAAGLGVALVPLSHGQCSEQILLRPLTDAAHVTRLLGVAHRRTALATAAADVLVAALTPTAAVKAAR